MLDLAHKVVFRLDLVLTDVARGDNLVDLIGERDGAHELMMHSANQSVSEDVVLIVVNNRTSISKLNFLVTADRQADRVEVGLDGKRRVARPSVQVLRALNKHI